MSLFRRGGIPTSNGVVCLAFPFKWGRKCCFWLIWGTSGGASKSRRETRYWENVGKWRFRCNAPSPVRSQLIGNLPQIGGLVSPDPRNLPQIGEIGT